MAQWEPLTDFENDYVIETETPHRIRRKRDERILKLTLDKRSGYVLVSLNGKTHLYHRILAKHFIPNPDDLPEVDHADRDKANNSLENLRWVNRSENNSNSGAIMQAKAAIWHTVIMRSKNRWRKASLISILALRLQVHDQIRRN